MQSCWLGRTELTEAQWAAVMGDGTKPSRLPKGDVAPADVKVFLDRLNTPTARFRFRLPRPDEAERAIGDVSQYGPETAWCAENSGNHVHDVATKKPNALGLYDIVGNCWEWCEGAQIYGAAFFDNRDALGPRFHKPRGGEPNYKTHVVL